MCDLGSGDACAYPCSMNTKNAVRCGPGLPPKTYACLSGPSIIPDPSRPIMMEYPADTGPCGPPAPRPDPLDSIPDSTVRTVVEMVRESTGDVIKSRLPHPLCPDAQLTLSIDPPQKKKVEIRVPECVCPVRGPQRPWIQCVESQLINDRVRRPLARLCHRRELPPLVIPCHEFRRLQLKVTQKERERAEREAIVAERECERLKSNYRHSLWNYTVDSLIDKKRKQEADKRQRDLDDAKQLLADVHAEKERTSKEELTRAKRQMLYRKGLIRDFHAAMANSKMLKDIEDEKKGVTKGRADEGSSPPFLNKACMAKMMMMNERPEYTKTKTKRPVNQAQLELLQMDEKRIPERQAEIQEELSEVQRLMLTCPSPLPPAYLKHIAEPKCDPDDTKIRQQKLKDSLFSEIHDKLATDAFIEAHEDEIDRQAYEFNNYKRTVERMRREKEQQLIDEKVAYNIRQSEKAAAALVEARKKKQLRANDYDELKDKWEAEWEAKVGLKGGEKEKLMELVYKDFSKRKVAEKYRKDLMDPQREWYREQLVAVENYDMECERKSERRKKAEELALYHLAQVKDKVNREERERGVNAAYGCKAKRDYEEEMSEMKAYANECIQDWEAKGRPIKPLIHSMRKWDYDAGMYPFPNPITQDDNNNIAKCAKKTNRPDYQTTSNRLGFACGGGT